MKRRLEYIDSLKGFAIFLVLWGHSVQHLRDKESAYDNPLFGFIYSFHMPLFFLISGFFFLSSLKLDFKDFLIKKATQLLLPCITWAFMMLALRVGGAIATKKSIDWAVELQSLYLPSNWPFWFFKELFLSYVIAYVSLKLLKKEWLAFAVSVGILFFVPGAGFQKFLLPMLWAGILLKKSQDFIFTYENKILITLGLCFAVCLFFWNGYYTIYVSGMPDLLHIDNVNLVYIHLYRFVIGLSGSIFFFLLFKKIYVKNYFFLSLEKIGFYTLAIYILQDTILEKVISRSVDFSNTNLWLYNLVITPASALITILICMGVIAVVKRFKKVEYFLFGSSYMS